MVMNNLYAVGPLNVKVSGTDKIVSLLKEEFSNSNFEGVADLEICVHENKVDAYKPTHFSGKGNMNFNANEFHVDINPFYYYEVSNAFNDGVMKVNIFLKRAGFAREAFRFLKSVLSVEYGSRAAYVKGEIASYSLLWSVVALCLLKNGHSFIHAGVLARNDKAIVLSGTGGCGKTSTVLNLLSNEGFQYLSEDFGIVSSEKAAYPCMKTVSLYRSDVDHGDPAAVNAVKALATSKKVRWDFLTKVIKANPIIKASPKSLTKLAIPSERVPLVYGIHLSRQDIASFELKEISVQEYAQRSANASGRELKPLSEILKLIAANSPKEYAVWSDGDLMQKLQDMYVNSFSGATTYELTVPYQSGPKEVCAFLLDKLAI